MSWIKNSLTLIITLSISLSIAEIAVRTLYPQNFSTSWYVIDTHGLILNKSSGHAFHTLGDRRADYAFEKFGVRSSFISKKNLASKALVLGDSFTFGWLLNNDNTYTTLMAKSNAQMAFLNAAAGGWGASDYTAYLETYCEKIKPDITLIIMNADDIGRMLRSSLYTYDPKYELITRSKYEPTSKHRMKVLLNSSSLYDFLLENFHLVHLAKSAYVGLSTFRQKNSVTNAHKKPSFGLMNVESIDYSNKFSASLFKYLKTISTACETELLIVYSGVQEKNNLGTYPTLEFLEYAKMNDFFENIGVRFIDLSDTSYMTEYRNNLESYTIKDDDHPNEDGAELIFNAIEQSGILSNDYK